jgi:hypothetical protein
MSCSSTVQYLYFYMCSVFLILEATVQCYYVVLELLLLTTGSTVLALYSSTVVVVLEYSATVQCYYVVLELLLLTTVLVLGVLY